MSNSKRRMIHPSFWTSETISTLTIEQRYLFVGLFSNADDQGRLRGHPALVRNAVFPYDAPDLEKITADLAAIEAIGSIQMYELDNTKYIQILKWWEYQHPQWAYPSEIPAPDGWNDRLRYKENNRIKTYNWRGTLDDDGGDGGGDGEGDGPPNGQGDSSQLLPEAIAKALPEAIAEPMAKATVLEIELGLINDDKKRACARVAIINQLYQNNIDPLPAQPTCQEINAPPYITAPILWWLEALKISCDNNVRKWSYIRAILDRSIKSNKSPSENKPQQQNGAQNGHSSRDQQSQRPAKGSGAELAKKPYFDPYKGELVYPDGTRVAAA